MARDDDPAPARRLVVHSQVLGVQAGLVARGAQDVGVLVTADGADVEDAVGGEDVLGASGRVLGGAAGDLDGLVVREEVFVEGHVGLRGEDCVVGLEAIFGEGGFIAVGG